MNLLLKLVSWLITSSSDPKKYSATILGLAGFIPSALILMNVFGMDGISEDDLKPVLNDLDGAVVAALAAFSGIIAFCGAVRKLYYRLVQIRQKFFE